MKVSGEEIVKVGVLDFAACLEIPLILLLL